MQTSSNGIALIQSFEKCRLKAYLCAAGKMTIGWGNTRYANGNKIKKGDEITQAEADALFVHWLPTYENIVKKLIPNCSNQNVFDAMTSFAYNTGGYYKNKAGKATSYDVWELIEDNCKLKIIAQKLRVTAITGGGKKLAGLVKRRSYEALLLETGELKLHV